MGKKIKSGWQLFLLSSTAFLFFNCQGTTNHKNVPPSSSDTTAQLTLDSIAIYRSLLQTDSLKPADSEFLRITKLQRALIDRFGYRGIYLALEFSDTVNCFPIGQFPSDCPWYRLNSYPPADFIKKNFAGLRKYLAGMTDTMVKYCAYIFAKKEDGNWKLHYLLNNHLYDGRPYFIVYTGGAPLTALSEKLPEGWTWPSMLRDFYRIHNGFEERDGIRLLAANEVAIPPHSPDDAPIGTGSTRLSFNDLLRVIDHGSDFEDCLLREKGATSGNYVVELDRDSWMVSEKKLELLPYLDFLFSRVNENE